MLISDLLLQLMSKLCNSRLCFGDPILWTKDKSKSLCSGCYPSLNDASALTGSLLRTLRHKTYCGLTLLLSHIA